MVGWQVKVNKVRVEINELLAREEVLWKQRSRVMWLEEGDRNSAFFHKTASARQSRNKIKGLEDENGQWQCDEHKIEEIALDFYHKLFTSEGTTDVDSLLDGMNGRDTEIMNEKLQAEFTEDEVLMALKQMHPLKAPGPNGFLVLFYQKIWDIVRKDVTEEVLTTL